MRRVSAVDGLAHAGVPGPASALASAGLVVRRGRAVLADGPVVAPVAGRGRVVFARRTSRRAVPDYGRPGCRRRRVRWRAGPAGLRAFAGARVARIVPAIIEKRQNNF